MSMIAMDAFLRQAEQGQGQGCKMFVKAYASTTGWVNMEFERNV
jgi:hypothetical protein